MHSTHALGAPVYANSNPHNVNHSTLDIHDGEGGSLPGWRVNWPRMDPPATGRVRATEVLLLGCSTVQEWQAKPGYHPYVKHISALWPNQGVVSREAAWVSPTHTKFEYIWVSMKWPSGNSGQAHVS